MRYKFKPLPELYFGVLVAVVTILMLELVGLNPDRITDWRQWSVALVVACIRAAAGVTLDWLRRSFVGDDDTEEALP